MNILFLCFEILTWGISVYQGTLYLDNNKQHALYNDSINFSVYNL